MLSKILVVHRSGGECNVCTACDVTLGDNGTNVSTWESLRGDEISDTSLSVTLTPTIILFLLKFSSTITDDRGDWGD